MFEKEKPDLIISFGTEINWVTIVVARRLKIPIIASEHNNYLHGLNRFFAVRFLSIRILYRRATVVTVLTDFDYKYYRRFLSNVVVMYNPVPATGRAQIGNKLPIVLAVGTYGAYYRKGFDRLITLFPYREYSGKRWKLWIAGKGAREPLEGFVRSAGYLQSVELLGEVKNMESLYTQSAIFALSSRSEGLPMVLLEAMSYGCACIAFDCVSGPSEIINNGVNGLLIRNGDTNEFKRKLIELMENADLRNRLGEAAIIRSKDFSVKKIGEQWIGLINKVLAEKQEGV